MANQTTSQVNTKVIMSEAEQGEQPASDLPLDELSKAKRLQRFRGPLEANDRQTAEFWRRASAAAHAVATIELSDYAERMAAQTGIGKDPSEMFPGFPSPLTKQSNSDHQA